MREKRSELKLTKRIKGLNGKSDFILPGIHFLFLEDQGIVFCSLDKYPCE